MTPKRLAEIEARCKQGYENWPTDAHAMCAEFIAAYKGARSFEKECRAVGITEPERQLPLVLEIFKGQIHTLDSALDVAFSWDDKLTDLYDEMKRARSAQTKQPHDPPAPEG